MTTTTTDLPEHVRDAQELLLRLTDGTDRDLSTWSSRAADRLSNLGFIYRKGGGVPYPTVAGWHAARALRDARRRRQQEFAWPSPEIAAVRNTLVEELRAAGASGGTYSLTNDGRFAVRYALPLGTDHPNGTERPAEPADDGTDYVEPAHVAVEHTGTDERQVIEDAIAGLRAL